MTEKQLLRIHGNCTWYKYHTSEWSKKHHGIGGCSNRGMVDLRYMNIHPLDESCEYFEGAKKLGSQHYFWERGKL